MRLTAVTAPWQWQMVRAEFDPVRGSEQAGTRPALIVSREAPNLVLPVLVVLPVTTRRSGRPIHIGEAFLPAGSGGLPNDSIAMCQQIRTISKERLLGSYGRLDDETLREAVRAALRVHLDLLA